MTRSHALALVSLVAFAVALAPSDAQAAKKKKDPAAAAAAGNKKGAKNAAPQKPAERAASTKGIEEKLKKAEEGEEEPTRLAPAKLDNQGVVTKDDKADKARDELITNLLKVIQKQKSADVKADLTFRLAEAYWEKSRYVRFNQEMPAYQVEADKWANCIREKGKAKCGGEPRPNTRLSETYRAQAVELYKQIRTTYPKYPRRAEVIFILSYNEMEMSILPENAANKKKFQEEALKGYREIVALYPESSFVCDSNVEIGNYYFDGNQLTPARRAFEEGAKPKCAKTITYATYKLAWCDYNAGDFAMSVKRFKDVITRAEKESADKVRLKSEALRDLVLAFEKAGELDTAIDYYVKVVGKQSSKPYIVRLAGQYFTQGGYDYAIKSYRYLMKELPVDPAAPEWQSKVLLAYDKMAKRANVREEAKKLVHDYAPGSIWFEANKKNQKIVQFAYDVAEEALYNLVTDYHQEATKTKQAITYKLARDIYKEYIDNFPETERSYQMRYYYAEILFALEDYQPAYEQYIKVAEDKKQDNFKKTAARNMLIAAEKLKKLESGEIQKTVTADSAIIDEDKDKGAIEEKKMKVTINKEQKSTDLTPMEKQFIAACDKYLQLIPSADDEAQVRLSSAVIYFDHARYVEASERFREIIKKWPQEPSSASAAALILEALEAKEEWAELEQAAREFSKNAKLLAGNDARKVEFRKKLPVYIEGSAFKLATIANEKDKDYAKASDMFAAFAKEFPKSTLAPVALYNRLLDEQNLKHLDVAINVASELITAYPKADDAEWKKLPSGEERKADLLPDTTFRLAKSYELTADFASAAKWYETFLDNFSGAVDPRTNKEKTAPDSRVLDAQFNAILWYKGLGEYDKAITACEKYVKTFTDLQKRHPKVIEETKPVGTAIVSYEIVNILELKKDWTKVIAKIDDYLKTYKGEEPYKKLNATYHQLLAYKELAKDKDVSRLASEIVSAGDKLSADDKARENVKLALGHSRFITLEPDYQKFLALKFRSAKTLGEDLQVELKSMKELGDKYLTVIADKNGDWAIAALVRTASLPRELAKDIRESPLPKGLTEDQIDIYKGNIEGKAQDFEDKGLTLYEEAMKRSFDLGIYNEWTLDAEKVLAEFKPDLFTPVRELPLKGSEFFFTETSGQALKAAGSGSN